jgi:hypothetical protein
VEVAGDAGISTVGGSGDALEKAFEEIGGGEALGEGEGLITELGFGVEKHGFVGEVLAEEGAVEMGAAFEKEAEDVAFGESGEDGGEAEPPGVIGDLIDLDAESAKSGGLCGCGEGAAEDEEVRI